MKRPRFVFVLMLALSLPNFAIAQQRSAAALPAAQSTLFTVSVRGQASQMPDVAVLSTGVTTEATESKVALRDNAARMERVMQAIKAAGIAEKDVHTSHIWLHPRYQYGNREVPRMTGYRASNTLSIKVRDITKLGQILDNLVAQGINQVSGPSFQIDEPDPVYDRARHHALETAHARAKLYAQALGLRVQRVVKLSEGSRSSSGFEPREMVMAQSARMDSADAVNTVVTPGEMTLSVNLEVVFELAP